MPVPRKNELVVVASVVVDRVTSLRSVKVLRPVKALLSAKSVVEATTMFAEPLKETPLIVRVFWRIVALPALPVIAPVMVWEKELAPEKPLLSERRVDEAVVSVGVPQENLPVTSQWRKVLPVHAARFAPKKLLVEAVVEVSLTVKKFVLVALVLVELRAVKF